MAVSSSHAESEYFQLSEINNGLLKVNYENIDNKDIKVMIQKDNERSFYDLKQFSQYPLTFGNGNYIVAILENVDGAKYKSISAEKIDVTIDDPIKVYLNPNQMLNWNEDMLAVKKAKELTKEITSNKEKALAIYEYIVKNFKYDYSKIDYIDNTYSPEAEAVFKNRLGICSDFSTLYAVMLRSVNIPVKYLQGNRSDITDYHAWNQVYLEESKEWITVDITYDNALYVKDMEYTFVKDADEYTIDKVY